MLFKMFKLFVYVSLMLCCQCVDSNDWSGASEPILLLDAAKTIYKKHTGNDILHPKEDYFKMDLKSDAVVAMKTQAKGFSQLDMDSHIRDAASQLISKNLNGNSASSTLDGEFPGENEATGSYGLYSLHKDCNDRTVLEEYREQSLGDDSNRITMWIVNKMSKEMPLDFTFSNTKSNTNTKVQTNESSNSVNGGFSIGSFLKASGSYTWESKDVQTEVVKNSDSLNIPYGFTLNASQAVKVMRNMLVNLNTIRYQIVCTLKGYVGLRLSNPYQNQKRWFLPVTELAKVYDGFVMDDSADNSVLFKYQSLEISSSSSDIIAAFGMNVSEVADIVERF